MEGMETPEAIVAEVEDLEDAPDDGTIVGKVSFTDVLIT